MSDSSNKPTRGGPGQPGQPGQPHSGPYGGQGGSGGEGGPGGEPSGQGGTGGPGGSGGEGGTGVGHGGVGGIPRWIGVFLIALALVSVGQGYYFSRAQRDDSACQAQINVAQTTRAKNLDGDLTSERNAGRVVDDALAAVVAASLQKPPPTPAEGRQLLINLDAALTKRAQARVAADQARKDNPPVDATTAC